MEYLYQDAVFVTECGEYHPSSKVYRAAKAVLNYCGEQHCTRCDKIKPLEDFREKAIDGPKRWCRKCETETHVQWQRNNKDHLNEYKRSRHRAMMDSLPEFLFREQTLYRLYDEQDNLLYIGVAWDVRQRFYQHKADKVWWNDVVRYELETYSDRDSVLQAERLAIQSELPAYNKVYANP